MKKMLHLSSFVAAFLPLAVTAQIPFSNQTPLLPTTTFHSGNAIGVCDMNGDGKDDIVRASQNTTMYIEYQGTSNGNFTESSFNNTFGSPWGMCIGDVDNNGKNDVLWGNGSSTYILVADNMATAYTGTNVSSATGAGNIFVQGANFAPVTQDHFIDAFVCDDVDMSHIYVNNNGSGWTFNQSLMPLATVPSSDNSGNYASLWTDINNDGLIDLYITHCRQNVSNSSDPRRINQIFLNNGNGTFTQDVTNTSNLRLGAQSWSTAWGDVDNDGDMDAFVLNYDVNSNMMLNDGAGVFTDVTSTCGVAPTDTYFGMNATFHDFDNDGNLDLLISGTEHYLYTGNGDGTFNAQTNPFVYNTNKITSHAVGDLNDDGFLDVYASYCNIYNSPSSRNDRLWMNASIDSGNTNHWIKFDLVGGAATGFSSLNGIGAIVKIYGAFGVQAREVRSGEAYGTQNSFEMHFGLGQNMGIDSVIIQWPSGIVDKMLSLPADQNVTVNEGAFPLHTNGIANATLNANVYPNPINNAGAIRIDNFASFGLNTLALRIYDVNGRVVYTEEKLTRSIIPLDTENYPAGLYFYEIVQGEKRLTTGKFISE
ncbi:MAG: FG-GAP-like repeat-containing protein [Bacteroidia bacterium]